MIKKNNENKYLNETLVSTKVKFGLTGIATLKDLDKLNKFLDTHPEITIFYRKITVNTLRIVEEGSA